MGVDADISHNKGRVGYCQKVTISKCLCMPIILEKKAKKCGITNSFFVSVVKIKAEFSPLLTQYVFMSIQFSWVTLEGRFCLS